MESNPMIYGPIASRRLGQSLGINNTLTPKACSYNCVYCQAGRTHHPQYTRSVFFEPKEIFKAVSDRLDEAMVRGIQIDYLSIVPDGEPTLDIRLGELIALLKTLGKPVAVFSNASLIWRPDVRADLAVADWVSLKMDAVDEISWRRIDRPRKFLSLSQILEGALAFSRQYRGFLVSETMLCAGLNDGIDQLLAVAAFLKTLQPKVAYLGVPTRPPLESWAKAPDNEVIARAFAIFSEVLPTVELIIGYPKAHFQPGSDIEARLPAILAVHPMRDAEVHEFIQKSGGEADVLRNLMSQGIIQKVHYGGHSFWIRSDL
jgi:wyosine [tRNA(Phe)-imidazoG37] synthetase (radical SAM superfamily)